MKIIKRTIIFIIILSLFIVPNSITTNAQYLGPGSEYKYNAPTYNLGDEIYCRIHSGDYYYKMYISEDTTIRVYGRGYDPYYDFSVSIYDSKGESINYLKSDQTNDWGYEQINEDIYLRKGTYYLGIYGYPYADNDYLYLKLTAITPTPKETPTPNNTKSKKKFSVSKKNITIKKGKRKSVTVTYKYTGTIYSQIKNNRIVSTKWGNWKGDKVKLYIRGKKKGKTKIYITNSKNKKKLVITVKVKK